MIFQHFGHAPGNDPIDALLDRYAPDPAIPYRTSAATAENMGVDQADAIASLMSFGLKCGADSCVDTDQDGTCDVADLDDDNDGCPDAREAGPDHSMGGDRDPLSGWDFFDTTGDQEITIDDALDILQYWGQPGDSPAANLRDRWIPDPSKPWRTASADDGIDGTDVLANLASFGDSCH